MKILIKTVAVLLLAAMTLTSLAACGGAKLRDDVPAGDLASALDTAVGNKGDMVPVDAGYVKNMLALDESSYESFLLKINAANLDEYGVFKGKDKAQTDALAKSIEDYIITRNEAWTFQYMPDEYPKLRDAEFKVVGNYVIYGILTEDAKTAAWDALNKELGA